jgi:RimJ/RimL family protein N-acetyltransferase
MLTGKLIRLRAIEMDDLDRYLAWINDGEVVRYLATAAPHPVSRAQEEEWIRTAVTHTRPPEITYAIETIDGDRHIGSVSLHRVGGPARHSELGIMVGDKTYWNRGYGTDAILTMLRYAFEDLNLNRVWLQVHDDNARAIACYRKCGFMEEGRLRQDRFRNGEYADTIVMGVLREEFRALYGVDSSRTSESADGDRR